MGQIEDFWRKVMRYLPTRFYVCSLVLLFVTLGAFAQDTGGISGTVVDETGAAIRGARITVSDENGVSRATTVTKNDGSFALTGLPLGRYRIKAESDQFQPGQSGVVTLESSANLSVNLKLRVRSVTQEITVTAATRSDVKIEDLPVSASVVTREAVQDSAAQSLDELLLTVPGLNLQEPPSFAQHPTSNAVSMRGLGGERTLVLLDGIPLNDAFFGYVQWNRVPLDAIDRVEVVRGGASSLWGSYAMSGVINTVTKAPARNNFSLFESYGTNNTYQLGGVGDLVTTDWLKLSLRADRFSTDGYNTTPKDQRGPLDIPTSFLQNNVQASALFGKSDGLAGYLRGNYHNNEQVLTTPAGRNDQHDAGVTGGITKRFGDTSYLELNSWFQHSRFVTFNTDVPSTGTVGSQEFVQNVHTTPADDFGASAQWSKSLGKKIQLIQFGTDFRRISGYDSAAIFDETGVQVRTDLGKGKQQFLGVFAQLALKPFAIPLEVTLSARYDHFRNYDGFDGNPGGSGIQPDRDKNSFDPRLALRYRINSTVALRGAVYRAFRAPTLDNLYRGFSTTSGTFLPNSQLGPETMVGGEVGSDFNVGHFVGGVTVFRNDVHDLIGSRNLADSELPPGFFFGSKNINVGKVRSDGIELTGEYAFSRNLVGNAAYTLTHSRVLENPEDPVSIGKQTANIPRNSAMAGLHWLPKPRWNLALQTRWVDRSFGDFDHTLPQDSHFVADAHIDYQLNRMVQLFFSASNLLNRSYVATNSGFEPEKLGPPFQAFFGVRLQLTGTEKPGKSN
jgi:outer membrane receptor protein involved in Fe transport